MASFITSTVSKSFVTWVNFVENNIEKPGKNSWIKKVK